MAEIPTVDTVEEAIALYQSIEAEGLEFAVVDGGTSSVSHAIARHPDGRVELRGYLPCCIVRSWLDRVNAKAEKQARRWWTWSL